MDAKIDYLSFTTPANLTGVGHSPDAWQHIDQTLRAAGHTVFMDFVGGLSATMKGGRAHYGAGLYYEDLHISFWFGGIANHILVEIAGVGCQALRDAGVLDLVVASAQARLTRLDVAVDFPGLGFPKDFIEYGFNGRFRSRASIESPTGWTEYVGGMKSERFARVYLYAPPHPRAGVTRVEHVLRSDYAKNAGEIFISSGLEGLVGAVGQSFGWKHPAWQPEDLTCGKLRSRRYDTHGAGTLLWIENAVLPALVRCHKEGLLTFPELLHRLAQKLDEDVQN